MIHPLRENLEVYGDSSGAWIRCSRCQQVLCPADEDWRKSARRKLLSPTKAGPLMRELTGKFVLEQLYCPSCGVLLNNEFVEDQQDGGKGTPQQA